MDFAGKYAVTWLSPERIGTLLGLSLPPQGDSGQAGPGLWVRVKRVLLRQRITEIDLSEHARALGRLRGMDYVLVIVCGESLLRALVGLAADPYEPLGVVGYLAIVSVLAYSVYTGWRHIGVIDPRVWRSYVIAFPLLLLLWGGLGLLNVMNVTSGSESAMPAIEALFLAIGVFVIARAWIELRRLRRMAQIEP